MKILRTPEKRFENIPEYPFEPHYIEIDDIRIHYVDVGSNNNETVLMIHGEPTWSFLYRKMIPIVAEAGFRVVAPDLVGFGKSDKLSEMTDYTYQRYVDWMTAWLKKLDLKNITLVCQDWGGLIGLRLAAENEKRFKRITASNTGLPDGKIKMSEAFLSWQEYSKTTPVMDIGKIVNGGCVTQLAPEVIAAYDAPFPEHSYKAAARIFPSLVPTSPDDPAVRENLKAWEVLSKWEKPFLTCFGDSDPITKYGDLYLQEKIPGTRGQKNRNIKGGGHFIQEDKGEEWARYVIEFINDN